MINIGVIGLGSHFLKSHFDYFVKNKNCKISSIFDLDGQKTDFIKKKLQDVYVAKSEDDLLKSEIDSVVIMTPDKFHAQSSLKALQNGKHVFCEKPLANNKTDLVLLDKSFAEAKEKGLVFTSCHPRRFDQPFLWLKNNIDSYIKLFGKVISFDFNFSYIKPPAKDIHESLLLDHFNHEIDLMNFILGYCDFEVQKLNDSKIKYRVAGIRKDGVSFVFGGSRLLDSKIYYENCLVRFESAELSVDTYGFVRIETYEESFDSKCSGTNYILRFEKVNNNFINSILKKDNNYLSEKDLKINSESGVYLYNYNFYKTI